MAKNSHGLTNGNPSQERIEDQLRQKIASKITVSTFLAGFNFTVLTLVLTLLSGKGSESGDLPLSPCLSLNAGSLLGIAITLFFLSSTLFVAAVYSYDRLLMPPCFRRYRRRSRMQSVLSSLFHKLGLSSDDPVYVYMISTWLMMFIPAIFFSTLGMLLMFLALLEYTIVIAILILTTLAVVYYHLLKPRLAID